MICIHCSEPVKSLFVVYSNNFIQLTDCPNCNETVDDYVELDNVLLFIDLLLLKPGAYRHLVFNTWTDNYTLTRFWIVLLTLEIYLKWIIEDNNFNKRSKQLLDINTNDSTNLGISFMTQIYQLGILKQYIYFTIFSVLDLFCFHTLLQWFIMKYWQNKRAKNDNTGNKNTDSTNRLLSYTILLTYGAKIFPILAIIWPYDTILSINIIKYMANLYIIESIKIVTNLSYFRILSIFTTVVLLKSIFVKPIWFYILTWGNLDLVKQYIKFEITTLLSSIR